MVDFGSQVNEKLPTANSCGFQTRSGSSEIRIEHWHITTSVHRTRQCDMTAMKKTRWTFRNKLLNDQPKIQFRRLGPVWFCGEVRLKRLCFSWMNVQSRSVRRNPSKQDQIKTFPLPVTKKSRIPRRISFLLDPQPTQLLPSSPSNQLCYELRSFYEKKLNL